MAASPHNEENPNIHKLTHHNTNPNHATIMAASDTSTTKVASSGHMLDKVHTEKDAAGKGTGPGHDAGVDAGATRINVWVAVGYGLRPASAGTHTHLLTIIISCISNSCIVLKYIFPGLSYVNDPECNELRLAEEGRLYVLHCEELTPPSPVGSAVNNIIKPIILAFAVSTFAVQYAFGMCMAYTGGAFVLFVIGSVVVSAGAALSLSSLACSGRSWGSPLPHRNPDCV